MQGKTVYISHATVALFTTTPGAVIYYTLDGKVPAYESPGERVIEGTVYNGPFQVLRSMTVTAAAVKPGMLIGVNSSAVTLKAARPVIVPAGGATQKLASPVTVTVSSSTAAASLLYSLPPTNTLRFYVGPFIALANGNITAVARKEGLLDSDPAIATYNLFVNTPVVTPNGSVVLADAANISLSTSTPASTILFTVCAAAQAMRLSNRSKGETVMTSADRCFPDCRGICRSGTNEGAACMDSQDIFETCAGGGSCKEEYHMIRLCDPVEWPRGAQTYTGPIEFNSTAFGSNSVIAAVAVQAGLERSQVVRNTVRIQASVPTLFAEGSGKLTGPVAPKEGDIGPLRAPVFINFTHPIPGAVILYTLDGTQPSMLNAKSTRVYIAGSGALVQLNVTTKVLAVATSGLLDPSPIVTTTVQIQLGAPELAATPHNDPTEQLLPPFIYPAFGARTESTLFWRPDKKALYINVSATLSINMPAATILFMVLPGAPTWSEAGGVYYDDSVAATPAAQLLASGWRRYTAGVIIPIASNVTIKSVAVLEGARSSAVSYTPGMHACLVAHVLLMCAHGCEQPLYRVLFMCSSQRSCRGARARLGCTTWREHMRALLHGISACIAGGLWRFEVITRTRMV